MRKHGLAILCTPLVGSQILQKSYLGDNGVVAGESSYRPRTLLLRRRLGSSWACSSAQSLSEALFIA